MKIFVVARIFGNKNIICFLALRWEVATRGIL